MEAQEPSKKKVNCPACQAVNDDRSKVCKVCGTALDAPDSGVTANAIDQELGRANLLRMRGQSKEAIELCLAILRKAHNNVTAHSLLGDIYYDQDDLRQAAEWYELASQLDPKAERERQLLERIRQRMKDKEQIQTLEHLGVETKAPAVNRYLIGGIVAIILVGIAGYAIGTAATNNAPTNSGTVSKPITVPPRQENTDLTQPENPITEPSPAFNDTNTETEVAALALLKTGKNAQLILDCVELPDKSALIVTARPQAEESAYVTAILVASDVFTTLSETRQATIRLVQDGKVVFSGEVTRDAYDEAQALSGQEGSDLESIAHQAFPTAWTTLGGSNVKPRSDQGATQSSGSVPDQHSGLPPESL